jgi:hypothetical protein
VRRHWHKFQSSSSEDEEGHTSEDGELGSIVRLKTEFLVIILWLGIPEEYYNGFDLLT